MKKNMFCTLVLSPLLLLSQVNQESYSLGELNSANKKSAKKMATLIPKKVKSNFGFIDQNSKLVIPAKFNNVGFFAEDCTLLNSPKESIRIYGSSDYASVMKNGKDYRIDRKGNMVYEFKVADQGRCPSDYRKQVYFAYSKNNNYGVVKLSGKSGIVKNFQIEPQYQLVHIMEGEDLENPMIVVVKNDKFGVVDKNNNIILPLIYDEIKRNFSWKLAGLFEVTTDGNNYFFVDVNGKAY